MASFNRRRFLRDSLATPALLAAGGLGFSRLALSAPATGEGDRAPRLVLVLLRGALDGLSAVPPYGDPAYAGLRREIALGSPGSTAGALRLDGTFGLHPAMPFLQQSFTAGELTVFHAVATPYRDRSHFDGQDLLENGGLRPHATTTGWLNRALALPNAAASVRRIGARAKSGVALGANVPLVMRGPAEVASWSPSRLAALDDDTLQRLADLYSRDPVLSMRLADALSSDAIASAAQEAVRDQPSSGSNAVRAAPGGARYAEIMRATAGFLTQPDGPRVATLETTGWDTHANEGGSQGQLALRLGALDGGLRALRDALGVAWQQTAVLLVTEFGRTAAVNGTRGTDHGTGAAAFLVGGAVRGGRVVSDWPGLGAGALYEGRDLRPTLDLRAVFKGVLHEHLGVTAVDLQRSVFPDSEAVAPLRDLLRTA